jgi:tRNA pseudouridine38-40 synthase
MPRYKLTIEYDGTPFSGWQKQEEGRLTVQEVLEAACTRFMGSSTLVEVHCSGRTDAGVHAIGQVAHVDFHEARIEQNIIRGINMLTLPHPVAVISAEMVPDDFHARFSTKSRSYRYRVVNREARLTLDEKRAWHIRKPLDIDAMNEAASYLLGHHDFTSFRSTVCQSNSPMKTLDVLKAERMGDDVFITASSRSFLHHQVRNMAGTLVLVGRGKWKPVQVKEALEARDRRASGPNAPAEGLYFWKVEY